MLAVHETAVRYLLARALALLGAAGLPLTTGTLLQRLRW